MDEVDRPSKQPLSEVTSSRQLTHDTETETRFDKTSVVLSGRSHNFSAEYELGFRDRHAGKLSSENPYQDKLARARWRRGWNARDVYSDSEYKWIEPITDSKAVVLAVLAIFLVGSFLFGFVK
ncbi:hypothetical protein KUD11_08500 [Roseovarius sp. LXJ103]|uniref:hypothetical protein n=1 Tax=Roseovarius carneus TaxID=2853164 RepID=UPI0011B22ECF|nr:hypothetical protein [Roseovarius carneus]MBZ8118688.1 hypothetical protein [Roseovarius carneus]